jgi:hypothetical protein
MNLNEGYVYRKGMSPQTRTVVSTKNKIYAKPSGHNNFLQIGVVASFEPSDSRSVEAIRGVGFGDQISELIPNASEPISISITRSALYLSLLMQTFGYNAGVDGLVRALKHHRWPFDIKQEIVFSEVSTKNIGGAPGVKTASDANLKALLTIYEGCWMTDYNWSFTSDTSLVQESCTVQCSDILDGKSNYEQFVVAGSVDSGNSPYINNQGGSQRFSSISQGTIIS